MRRLEVAGILFCVAAGIAAGVAAQEPPRVIARESVLVRTVKVVLTDKSGRPLRMAPAVSDFEIYEDALPGTLLGIEPLFEHSASTLVPPPDKLEEVARAAASRPPAAASPARRLPQVFYLSLIHI